jgi:hypothetical protein
MFGMGIKFRYRYILPHLPHIGGRAVTPEIDYEASITFENTPLGVKKAQVLSFPFQSKTVNLRNITIAD